MGKSPKTSVSRSQSGNRKTIRITVKCGKSKSTGVIKTASK